ncbi:MAG: DEAD/DEAH box helicase family protein [Gammaproteobacteria bacterium]|nr:DEAD/DEAH box helicase family protein [Gammaproteobacteria bacterium]
MRYTLKDYQEEAVAEVLKRLAWARDDWHQRRSPVAFSLTATTGAGKTVMAAAVIEALFHGNPAYDFDSDPGAVVLWFTDDPSLNEQTRFRLMDASDRLTHSRFVVIRNTFNRATLQAGKVYFLNRQKLSKKSLLVRGAPGDSVPGTQRDLLPMPDARAFTLWDTLANTIAEEGRTLYLILDEAHRGMKQPSQSERAEKATIVQRLINGANEVPPVPIVWGISATVQRFNEAMDRAEGRTAYSHVVVDPVRVQESGLLKDDIRLGFPAEAGQFNTVLLTRATQKVKEATDRWRAYSEQEGLSSDTVVPLLVVQVPNKPSDELLLSAFTTIQDAWPELDEHAMAHVFGDHASIEVGGFSIPHVRPETVQDRTEIRVLLAKDAISTGWDCPRAEVLVSFRPARDETHITQLLGRMVRTPLARRVPGDDVLNSVACVLPNFDRRTATRVAKAMMGDRMHDADGTGGGAGRRVLLAPVDMVPNRTIPGAVWEALDEVPSQTLPRRAARPVRRLAALAQALSRDGLREGARKDAYRRLFAKLDGLLVQHRDEVAAASKGILEVHGETLVIRVVDGEIMGHQGFVAVADEQSVKADFQAAKRTFTADLASKYASQLARGNHDDDGLFDAHVKVAALAQVEGVPDELDREADTIAKRWFAKYRVAIRGLTDERRTVYDEIRGMSPEPRTIEVKRPRIRTEETKDDEARELEIRAGHLMSDHDGNFPVGLLNTWEIEVLDTEMGRSGFQAWYRNPARPSVDALAVAYRDARGRWRRMCPDFLFFHGDGGTVKVSIVDPHSPHFADALPKLRGLAGFAVKYGESFERIESVARMPGGTLRVLDLTEPAVREAVIKAEDAEALYRSDAAADY